MCRDRRHGGRRCPSNDHARKGVTIRQRVNRYARRLDSADAAGDERNVARWDRLFRKAMDDEVAHAQRPPLPAPAPTRAAEFTIESTVDMSEADLQRAWHECAGDPHARDAIAQVMQWRDEQDAKRDAEIAAEKASEEARAQFRDGWGSLPSDPLHSPARRKARRLTPDQEAREEYQRYMGAQYLKALDECKTAMLNHRGQAAGVDERDLFFGPAHVARAYASEELQSWWRRNGRLTFAAFRHHLLDRDSDRAAATRARLVDFNDAA